MRGGALRRPVLIQQGAAGAGTEGDASLTWSTLTTAWASISQASAEAIQSAAQRDERITHQVTIRYRSGLPNPASLRFVYKSRYFFVKTIVDVDERHQELDCHCEEIVVAVAGAE